MQIKLGGSTFELASGTFVTKQPLIEYPQHLRTTGQQERGGQTLMSNWWLENFESGFGCSRIDLASDRMKTSFWDSTADTIYRGQVTNPVKYSEVAMGATTHTAPYFTFEFGGTTWGVTAAFSTLYGRVKSNTTAANMKLLQYTGTTWAYSNLVFTSTITHTVAKMPDYVGGLPCFMYLGSIAGSLNNYGRVCIPTASDIVFQKTSGGLTPFYWKWANSSRTAVVNTPTNDNFHALSPIDATNATTKDFGDYGLAGTRSPVQHMHMFQGQDGYEGLFIFYKNKLTCWENFYHDIVNNVVESSEIPYLDLFGLDDANNMQDVAVFNGSMVFAVQDSLLAYSADGSVMDIGMNLFSGMPSDKQGKVEALCSSVRHLFAMVNTSGVRRIYQFDGAGWHWFGETPTLGDTATSFGWLHMVKTPAGVPQLMVNVEGASVAYTWDYPDANPLVLPTGGTINWEATSHVITPEFDGGLPNQTGVAYKLSVEGVFGSGRAATFYYSTLGGATGWVALGQATQSGRTTFDFGTLGIPHDIIQFEFGLSGNATSTPVIRTVVLDYLKFPEVRDVYTFTVDLVKTYGGNLASVQTGLDALASIRDSYPMVPFKYGDNATVNVKVLEMPSQEESVTATDGVYATTGMAALITMRAVKLI